MTMPVKRLRRIASGAKRRYLRRKYTRGAVALKRPTSVPDNRWNVLTSLESHMRYAWLRQVVRGSVLDVGCAECYATTQMAAVADRVTGLDRSDEFLARGEELLRVNEISDIDLVKGDATALPFPDKSFDTVTLLEILEHMDDPSTAIQEALRVARRRVVITVPAHGHMRDVKGHVNDFTTEDLIALLPSAQIAEVHEPFLFVMHEIQHT